MGLVELRHQLLTLHRALLDAARIAFEREHGRVSAGAFLGQVISAPELAWLQPLTALVVALDEALETPEADSAPELAAIRELLLPRPDGSEFERHYAAALQAAPEVVLAHAAVMRALDQAAKRAP